MIDPSSSSLLSGICPSCSGSHGFPLRVLGVHAAGTILQLCNQGCPQGRGRREKRKNKNELKDSPTHTSSCRGPFPRPLARQMVSLHSCILDLSSKTRDKRGKEELRLPSPYGSFFKFWLFLPVHPHCGCIRVHGWLLVYFVQSFQL